MVSRVWRTIRSSVPCSTAMRPPFSSLGIQVDSWIEYGAASLGCQVGQARVYAGGGCLGKSEMARGQGSSAFGIARRVAMWVLSNYSGQGAVWQNSAEF